MTRPGPVQATIAAVTAATRPRSVAPNTRVLALSQTEMLRKRRAPEPHCSGGLTVSMTGMKWPPAAPEHQYQAQSQHQGHGQRLPHRRDLALAHLRDAGGGGEEHRGIDASVGVEDHRLGTRQTGGNGVREAVLQQRLAPSSEKPGPAVLTLVLRRPCGDLQRALQGEPGVKQVGHHAEDVHTGLAPEKEHAHKPLHKPGHGAPSSPMESASGSTAAACPVRAPLRSASKGSALPAATSAQMRSPMGLPPIWLTQ